VAIWTVTLLLLVLALAVLVRTAWVCDDAYITFRVADNFVHGYGLRWNVDERVAVFTHPLWLFLFSSVYAITGEAYYTAVFLGIGLTLITMLGLAVRVAPGAAAGALALVALLSSKAFVDFSTSGLENPLTHLLLIVFVLQWARRDDGPRALVRLWASAALALVNRLDLFLLIAPALAAATVMSAQRIGRVAAIRAAVVGLTPLIAWMAFSTIYFGFPVPNTAYAKLGTGVSSLALVQQGLYFMGLGFRFDPVTLLMIAAAPAALAFRRARSDWPLVVGVLLMVAYVIRIGGDFMYGRFLTAPFFVSLLILIRVAPRLSWSKAGLTAAAILVVALSAPYQPSLLADAHFGARDPANKNLETRGIHDERRWYYPQTGLLRQEAGAIHPNHPWAYDGLNFRAADDRLVVRGNIGFLGYFAGPRVHIIDPYALADPLLARLPALPNSRIGHFRRELPAGYAESVVEKRVLISDPSLGEYYRRLRLVIAGPLFSRARLKAILELNSGRLDYLIDAYTKARTIA
jgi:arabinofuranosyltransferase